MGCSEPSFNDARPWHRVQLKSFWMDPTPVTNEQFSAFVRATGYKTIAERKPEAKDFPDAPPENLVAGALVFSPPAGPVPLGNHYQWWRYIHGADWRHPEGPASDIKNKMNHPVVQIAWPDAEAYARWAGKRLPTEAEFEYAARGGLDRKAYSWGDELRPGGKCHANLWQGQFPHSNTCEDGYITTSPVKAFPPNGYHLYGMTGNVWQWCSDWYRTDAYSNKDPKEVLVCPQGPSESFDRIEPHAKKKVQRGGSFLCTDQYCARYLVGARGRGEVSSGCNNLGFRCVADVKK